MLIKTFESKKRSRFPILYIYYPNSTLMNKVKTFTYMYLNKKS